MTDVGKALRDARAARGLTHERIEEDTRIPVRYLRALEGDAPLDAFPAPFYARAFLREYVKYLGLDEHACLEAFDSLHPRSDAADPAMVVGPAVRRPRARRRTAAGLVVLSILVLVAIAARGLIDRGAGAPLHAVPPPPATQTTTPPPTSPPPTVPPPATHVVVRVDAVTGPCWVQSSVAGIVKQAETLAVGQSVTLKAEHQLEVILGNAPGVQITVNGKAYRPPASPTGTTVAQLQFTLSGGKVHTQVL